MLARLLATPVTEPRRSRSRVRPRALAVAGAAVAAVSRGGVYHVVEQMTLRGPGRPAELDSESWYTHDGRLHRTSSTTREGQRVVEELAGRRRPGRSAGSALQWDRSSNTIGEGGFASGGALPFLDPFTDPGAQLQALDKKRRAARGGHDHGRRQARRPARVRQGPRGQGPDGGRDRRGREDLPPAHAAPHDEAGSRPKFVALTRYSVYERLALNDKTERRLALDATRARSAPRARTS